MRRPCSSTLAQSVEERDPAMAEHCQRIALLASSLGIALGLPAADLVSLQRGGFLHDIGKVGIPDHILFKPGPLTPAGMGDYARTHRARRANLPEDAVPARHVAHHPVITTSVGMDRVIPMDLRGRADSTAGADHTDCGHLRRAHEQRPYKKAYLPRSTRCSSSARRASLGWRDPELVAKFGEIYSMFRIHLLPKTGDRSLQALAEAIQRKDVESAETQSFAGSRRTVAATIRSFGRR